MDDEETIQNSMLSFSFPFMGSKSAVHTRLNQKIDRNHMGAIGGTEGAAGVPIFPHIIRLLLTSSMSYVYLHRFVAMFYTEFIQARSPKRAVVQ